ncbi:MAG: recombinase family protein [Pseudomonadota bacterium]
MRIGYARVSTSDQCLDLQRDALEEAGCTEIYEDHGVSGIAKERPELTKAIDQLEPGDVLVVWRLDRLARSMHELCDLVKMLHERQIGFQSLCEYIDIGSAFGELIVHIISAIIHFERRLIIERTEAGMQAARERGAKFGRKRALEPVALERALAQRRMGMPVGEIATDIGVGRSTLYRYLQRI